MMREDLGYAHRHQEYDAYGNVVKETYYNENEEPAIWKEAGYASCEKLFENGNQIACSYYDTNEKLTLRKDYGYAIRKNQYDKYGRTIFRRYYGIEGEPVINSEDHCAGWGYWYDEKGNETDVWYVVLHPVSNNTLLG